MTGRDVETIVRGVIIDRGLPFDVLDVIASPSGWDVRLRQRTGGSLSVTVRDGRPVAVRIAIQEQLESQL